MAGERPPAAAVGIILRVEKQFRNPGWSLAAPVAASVLFSFVFIARTAFVVDGRLYVTLFDDAMISMRYARNLADGHGLLWNPGQVPIEGYTNFLWTLWMAALHFVPVPESKIALLVMLSGAAILAANVAIVRLVVLEIEPETPRAAAVAMWTTALYYPLIYWTLRGMEVGFVTLTLSIAVLLALRLRRRFQFRELVTLALLIAAGMLTRTDVAVPCVVIAGFVIVTAASEHRRAATIALGIAVAGTLALHTGFRLLYYGALLPNTFYLKVQGAALAARLPRGVRGLIGFGMFHLAVPIALSATCLVVCGRRARPGAYLLATIALALGAFSAYVGGDAWDSMLYANRYITPGMPGLLVLSALAIDHLVKDRSLVARGVVYGLAGLFVLVAILNLIAPTSINAQPLDVDDGRWRAALAMLTLMPILALPLLLLARRAATRPAARELPLARMQSGVAVVLTVASLVAVNGAALSGWMRHNAFYVDDDAWTTRYGIALRSATADDATIAVTWAGAIAYFSHRPMIDLLGKSDPVIASGPRQPAAGFDPGHDKWDYRYSISRLRPDVVAELWHATDDDIAAIERSGYLRLAPWVFTRVDSKRVDRQAVQRIACVILPADPFILGSAVKRPASDEERGSRYCRD
jgi:hypothetical protein